MEPLSKLFGSPARVKLLRLFFFNPGAVYDRDSVVDRARVTPETASKELAALARAGITNRKTFYKEVVRPGTKTPKRRRTIGWVLNPKFPYIPELSRFLRDTLAISDKELRRRMRNVGTIKLLVLSGFLIGEKDTSIDVLIVADKVSETSLRSAISSIEADCGQEIRYAVLPVDDYRYRLRVRDRLVREVLDFPHKVIIEKIATA